MLSHLVISGHEESRTCFATILDKGAGKLFCRWATGRARGTSEGPQPTLVGRFYVYFTEALPSAMR